MPDAPLPPTGQSVDSVTASPGPSVAPTPTASGPEVKHTKKMLTLIGGVVYIAYLLWMSALLALLPSPTGELRPLVPIGLLSSLIGAVGFLAAGAFAFKRIAKADVSVAVRRMSMIKLVALLIPVLILSAITPILIQREP